MRLPIFVISRYGNTVSYMSLCSWSTRGVSGDLIRELIAFEAMEVQV